MKSPLNIILLFVCFIFSTQEMHGQFGAYLNLDGIDDYMSVADHDDLDINPGEDFTVTCWVRTQSTATYYWIVNKRGGTSPSDAGYDLITNITSGSFGINLRTTTGATGGPPFGTTSIADGVWHHLAMVVNVGDQTAKIYVDGNEDQSNTYSGFGTESFENGLPLQIGTNGGQSVFWGGDIDELRIWSVPFSESDLAMDMSNMVDGTEANLLASWDFENISPDGMVSELTGNHGGQIFGQDVIDPPGNEPIVFNQHPKNLQLFARDQNDEAEVQISGMVINPDIDSIIFELYKDNVLIERNSSSLSYVGGSADFSNTFTIQAELSLYDVFVHLDSQNVIQQVSETQDIVAGDAYLIQGQSNAWAIDYDNVADWNSPYLRTLGRTAWYNQGSPADANDSTWYIAQGHTQNASAAIGVYALELGRLLIDNHGIPVAIFNGSGGGGAITNYFRNDANPQDLNTVYGRLLYRIDKAELTNQIKAITWNQGESENSFAQYQGQFEGMYNDLLEDYPNVENFYIFQIPPGCVNNSQANQLREVQRHLSESFDNMRVMSRCNLPGHEYDFCHYHFEGYEAMAFWIYRQIAEDFFDATFAVNVDPPNLIQATYVSSTHDQIALIFDQAVAWNPSEIFNGTTYYLKDHIYLDGDFGMIENGYASGDTIFLNLTTNMVFENISYTPNKFYNNTFETYEGPWISGENSIGALTFFEVPIEMDYVSSVFIIDESSSIEVLPNPADSFLKVHIILKASRKIQASIFNTSGEEVVKVANQKFDIGMHLLTIDIRSFPSGVYFLKMNSGGKIKTEKIVVLK